MTQDAAWAEAYEDAMMAAVKQQEVLGIDIPNDYCLRYDPYIPAHGWPAYVVERLEGIRLEATRPWMNRGFGRKSTPILDAANESIPGHVLFAKLGRGNLAFAKFFSLTQQFTNKPVKFSVIDPTTVSRFVYDEYYKDPAERMFEFARVYNEEYRDLVNAGCKIIQTDDFPPLMWAGVQPNPVFGAVDKDIVKYMTDAYNASVKGINAQFWLHECWGRPRSQLLFGRTGSWAEGLKLIGDLKTDVVEIEEASTEGKNLEEELTAWKEYCPDKEIGIGVVNHRTTIIETKEEVAALIRKALKFVPAESLCLSTDCGLAGIPRDIASFKLLSISEGAKLVRKELGYDQFL